MTMEQNRMEQNENGTEPKKGMCHYNLSCEHLCSCSAKWHDYFTVI